MAEPIYENIPISAAGLSESVVLFENPNDVENMELNEKMANITIEASPTVQIKDQHGVVDLRYEHVEEVRSTKNKNLLQLTSKDGQTYFIKFDTRESLTHWLKIFKTTLHVSGIRRQRHSSDRHFRENKFAETQRNRLSTPTVQPEFTGKEESFSNNGDVTYDDTATPGSWEVWKAERRVPSSGGYLTTIREVQDCNVFIQQMVGDFIYYKEASLDSFKTRTPSSDHYQALSHSTNHSADHDHEFGYKPQPLHGLQSGGPTEGLFNVNAKQGLEGEDYQPFLQSVPRSIDI